MLCKRGICRVYVSGTKVETHIVDHTKVSISSVFARSSHHLVWQKVAAAPRSFALYEALDVLEGFLKDCAQSHLSYG